MRAEAEPKEAALRSHHVVEPITVRFPGLKFLHIPTIGQGRRMSAEEAINWTELRFGQLAFKYASRSGERKWFCLSTANKRWRDVIKAFG